MRVRATLAVSVFLGLGQVGCSGDEDEKPTQVTIDNSKPGDEDEPGDEGTGDGDSQGDGDGDTKPPAEGDGDGDVDPPTDDGGTEPGCGGPCPEGTACNVATDECEPVAPSCPCAEGSHCDEATNTCKPGCSLDEHCKDTERCDSEAHTCVPRPECAGTLVPGLALRKIAINQAVEVTLAAEGEALTPDQREAPVVHNRGALFRISVTPDASYVPTTVTAELTLVNDGTETKLTSSDMVTSASDESTLDGTLNIPVDASLIREGTTYSVALTQAACADTPGTARFPQEGSAALGAEKVGKLRVVIVPYERAPFKLAVSPETLKKVEEGLYAYYPVEGVELTVREAVPVQNPQTDLSRVLQHIRGVREADGPDDDVFYYGMFTAADTLRDYCGDGCVAGIATLGGGGASGDPAERYGVGLGYLTDEATTSHGQPTTDIDISVNVMAHELGHAHGRRHTPAPDAGLCSEAAGPDPNFPNDTADIDTYGYNLITGELALPKVHKDLMAYCEPNWIHPYTYSALALRTQRIQGASARVEKSAPREYASVIVHASGEVSWGDNVVLRRPPSGARALVRAFDAADQLLADAVPVTVTELADVDAVLVTLPVPELRWASLELDGQRIPVR